ncbi:MAG: DUF362 domain-containing protein [Candidatus Thorarchaeota archaeon]
MKRSPSEALRIALSKLSHPIVPPNEVTRVVIKPSIYNPDLPGNTDWRMVLGIFQMFRSLGPVTVVESDNPLRTAREAFTKSGYSEFVEMGIELVNLSNDDMVQVKFAGHYFDERKMPQILHSNAFMVNIATLKAEPDVCVVGAGIKNLFGLLPELDKSVYHSTINPILMDLLLAYRPDLTVIDLSKVVIGNRENGQSKHVGGVIVGTDPVAVDSYCSFLLGIDPMKVDYLRIAHSLGLGEALLDRIAVRGTEHQIEELTQLLRK